MCSSDLAAAGIALRRQAPIGPYYADFACHRARIVIEVDGLQHAESGQQEHDAKRTRFLKANGYRVFRYWNFEAEPDAVAQEILLFASPPPLPLPTLGEGK